MYKQGKRVRIVHAKGLRIPSTVITTGTVRNTRFSGCTGTVGYDIITDEGDLIEAVPETQLEAV